MERLQRSGGMAGSTAAVLLALAFLVYLSSRLDPQTAADPTRALPLIAQASSRWAAAGILFVLAAAFTVLFVAGLSDRLREQAPTRASALLYFALIGLTAYSLTGVVQWQGGQALAAYAATDETAASHAWVALRAVVRGLNSVGNGFAGASIAVAGWAIIETAAFAAALGWFGIITGIVLIVGVFIPTSQVWFSASIVLSVIWLAWAGSQLLRRA